MKNYPSFQNKKLNAELIHNIKKLFPNYTQFAIGTAKLKITENGGVHYSGVLKESNCINFELPIGNNKIIISMIEYPKGLLFHAHIYLPNIEDNSYNKLSNQVNIIYNKIKEVI